MGAGGDEAQKIAAGKEGEVLNPLAWSPDGTKIACARLHQDADKYEVYIESRSLKGNATATILSDPNISGLVWLPNGRIVYSRPESAWQARDADLWEIEVNEQTGKPVSKPRRITNWAGFTLWGLSGSTDGKRLAIVRGTSQTDVYVGELEANGTRLRTPRRLTLDDWNDFPFSWTADSKAVLFASDRNGNFDIFKQDIRQQSAEAIVTGPENEGQPRLSPDGSWILYYESQKSAIPSTQARLMRVSTSGGAPQQVLTARGYFDKQCSRLPANVCVYNETDAKNWVLYSFDPIRGKGRELLRVESGGFTSWGIAPDGSCIGLAMEDPKTGHIRLLSLTGKPQRDILFTGWGALNSMDWDAAGKGMYVSSSPPGIGATLLHVDLQGKVHVLWHQKGSPGTWGVASPDGRHLAILGSTNTGDAWLLENF